MPGVTVITSGQPGTTSQVRIRGFSSFSNNEPLYVVDGIPTTSIDFLNANDIDVTTVLKDAASASIYGARAASGVIIVTTKHGKANNGKLNVNYDLSYGFTYPGKGLDLLTPQQQADWTWSALKAAGQTLTRRGRAGIRLPSLRRFRERRQRAHATHAGYSGPVPGEGCIRPAGEPRRRREVPAAASRKIQGRSLPLLSRV